MPSEIRWPSVVVVIAFLSAIVAMAWLETSPTDIAALSAFAVAVVGAMRRMYRPKSGEGQPPAPPPLSILMLLVALPLTTACEIGCSGSTSRDAASAGYLAQQIECVDRATTIEESKECRQRVRESWSVDAGAEGGAQ